MRTSFRILYPGLNIIRIRMWEILCTPAWLGYLSVGLLIAFGASTAESACPSGVAELWAYSNPSTHNFEDSYKDSITKYITSDKGSVCRWKVTASDRNEVVKLSFSSFQLKQSDGKSSSDCVEIYDGSDEKADLLDKVCDSQPQTYTSSGRYLFIVYRRGKEEGRRKFNIVIKAEDDMNKDQIIRIAIIIGACVAAFVVLYIIIRSTKCCACLRKKDHDEEEIGDNTERDCLTRAAGNTVPETNTTTVVPGDHQVTLTGGASGSASALDEGGDSVSLPSDTPSLHELNEPPPSYESLYLNEDGIAPPEYTPPSHKKSHPPRRVHTFN